MPIVTDPAARINGVETPEEADADAEAIGRKLAQPGESRYPFAYGALMVSLRTLYRQHQAVHALYLETLERLQATSCEFWPDELPELPDAAYYEPELASTES